MFFNFIIIFLLVCAGKWIHGKWIDVDLFPNLFRRPLTYFLNKQVKKQSSSNQAEPSETADTLLSLYPVTFHLFHLKLAVSA